MVTNTELQYKCMQGTSQAETSTGFPNSTKHPVNSNSLYQVVIFDLLPRLDDVIKEEIWAPGLIITLEERHASCPSEPLERHYHRSLPSERTVSWIDQQHCKEKQYVVSNPLFRRVSWCTNVKKNILPRIQKISPFYTIQVILPQLRMIF